MKVGDIVKQSKQDSDASNEHETLGIVVDISELPEWMKKGKKSAWSKVVGRSVSVMWSDGKIDKVVSESILEVIVESD